MNVCPLEILATGLVTSVGMSAAASCAAMRAKLTNPVQTRYIDVRGQWIMGHEVRLEEPLRGIAKLARMAAMAIEEALDEVAREKWERIPLLLCIAETHRPGRIEDLDTSLIHELQKQLRTKFAPGSAVLPLGRVAVATALAQAREMIARRRAAQVLLAAADSLLDAGALDHFQRKDRLLISGNSNGFMPGEGAAALLVGPVTRAAGTTVRGCGFATEQAGIDSAQPLRGEGLARAITLALSEAGLPMHAVDLRIADVAGEHYYFKEAALALLRTLRQRKEEIDLWHPAECIGETGSVAGGAVLAAADAAWRKGYAKGPCTLVHFSSDDGRRAALSLYREDGS